MNKKLCLVFCVALLFNVNTYAQFALGDIAFSAYNSDTATPDDAFTIVLLRGVTPGEQISFTDNGGFKTLEALEQVKPSAR